MKLLSLILAITALTACANSSQTYTADGKVGHSINCSGTVRNWGMCYEKAGEICGAKGYEVLEKNGEKGITASGSGSGVAGTYNESFQMNSTHSRILIITCKE